MKKNNIKQDLQALLQKNTQLDVEIFRLYESIDLEIELFHKIQQEFHEIDLILDKKMKIAILDRIVKLQETSLIQELRQRKYSQDLIEKIQDKLLKLNIDFYARRHQELLDFIEEKELFSEFHRCIFRGVHDIGLSINIFFVQWKNKIFKEIYAPLSKTYTHKEMLKILQNTMDRDNGEIADRSYSIVQKGDCDDFEKLSYASAFCEISSQIAKKIAKLLERLQILEDELFDQKDLYLQYFLALKQVFLEKDCDLLIQKWRQVDEYWIQIDTPFQICHFFEYYEDRYRHCVSPEWDLRICYLEDSDFVSNSIIACFDYFASQTDLNKQSYEQTLRVLKTTKSYRASFGLFYGSQNNGLFSAQVIPNDETLMKQYGKKIFAFPDRVRMIAINKPKLWLHYEVFGGKIMSEYFDILQNQPELWERVYAISTNGHEFGHILWMEDDTQVSMNKSGHFKNIEEFKATSGGLVGYFLQDDENCIQALMLDHLIRCINILGYREQEEMLPYYYEVLLHLYGAFETGVLIFDEHAKGNKLKVIKEKYQSFKKWYLDAYKELVLFYQNKRDAKEWLERYMDSSTRSLNLKNANDFVQWYWKQYQEYGRRIL